MRHRHAGTALYHAMPPGEWVGNDWAYVTLRERIGPAFTAPFVLFKRLTDAGLIERRCTRKNHNNQVIAEFRKLPLEILPLDQF